MILYYRKNLDVVMRSQTKIDCLLDFIEYTPTIDEEKKMKQNWLMKVKDGQIEFEKPQHILEKEKPTIEELKTMIDKATSIEDLKEIITKMLDK